MRTFLLKFFGYFDITKLWRGKKEGNLNLRFMHGINRISIFMFLICVAVMVYRYLAK